QWEYACRANTTTPWWFGGDPRQMTRADNCLDRRGLILIGRRPGDAADDGFALHAPVGSFAANPFGLHDLYGNVAEWCRDPICSYAAVAPRRGDGLRTRAEVRGRCLRGGSLASPATQARSASRRAPLPGVRTYTHGLRPARRLES
ncbi:MAG: SUMF1/EgtB/PvdO family nonheme iron enzyme, partial [Planctomycetes bacterium]|nr:SUMF1/EgtB/PvdO family nonheme iron enzyme [Planctomycetota bacterium]